MVFIKSWLSKCLWLLLALVLLFLALFLNVFLGLDQGEESKQLDVIIVTEGAPDRAYRGASSRWIFYYFESVDCVSSHSITYCCLL